MPSIVGGKSVFSKLPAGIGKDQFLKSAKQIRSQSLMLAKSLKAPTLTLKAQMPVGLIAMPFQASHLPACVDLITFGGVTRHPLLRGKVNPVLLKMALRILAERAVEDELSVACVDQRTGKVVSVLLAEDYFDVPPSAFFTVKDRDPKLKGISDLAQHLGSPFRARCIRENKWDFGTTYHPFAMCTAMEYEGNGLFTSLISSALELARSKSFTYMVAECCDPITRHVFFNKLKAENVFSMHLDLFELPDGTAPFRTNFLDASFALVRC